MKNLATVEKVIRVKKHPNADRLDLVKVLGYQCVVQRGLYKAGDFVVYIKTDTILPDHPWADEYRKYSPKRVKAVKLRGEWSEGILVSPGQLQVRLVGIPVATGFPSYMGEGYDLTEVLQVTKYEPPAPTDLQAKRAGLPYDIPKTDEERWENMVDKIPFGAYVDVTLKIDGQSATYYYNVEEDVFGVTSRGMELKPEAKNAFTAHIDRYNIEEKLRAYCKEHGVSLAIRGESYGVGIQTGDNNPHSKVPQALALFSVYDIGNRQYMRMGDPHYFTDLAAYLNIPHVPVIERGVKLNMELIKYYSIGIDKINGLPFEGVVINHRGGSFKVINKHYDSKK